MIDAAVVILLIFFGIVELFIHAVFFYGIYNIVLKVAKKKSEEVSGDAD